MKPTLLQILFVIFLLLCNCASAAPLTKDDVVGTYQVGASTVDAPHVPTNFYAVTITLNADGSFVASNAPASFFFSFTAPDSSMPKILTHGTWKLSPEYESANEDEDATVDLAFATASWTGSWSHPIKFYQGTPRIDVTYLPFGDYSAKFDFYLTKEKK
jgi:hypothetical protein